jgi:hypothetical protein
MAADDTRFLARWEEGAFSFPWRGHGRVVPLTEMPLAPTQRNSTLPFISSAVKAS